MVSTFPITLSFVPIAISWTISCSLFLHHFLAVPFHHVIISPRAFSQSGQYGFALVNGIIPSLHNGHSLPSIALELICTSKTSNTSLAINRHNLVHLVFLNHFFRIWNKYPLCDCFSKVNVNIVVGCVL